MHDVFRGTNDVTFLKYANESTTNDEPHSVSRGPPGLKTIRDKVRLTFDSKQRIKNQVRNHFSEHIRILHMPELLVITTKLFRREYSAGVKIGNFTYYYKPIDVSSILDLLPMRF